MSKRRKDASSASSREHDAEQAYQACDLFLQTQSLVHNMLSKWPADSPHFMEFCNQMQEISSKANDNPLLQTPGVKLMRAIEQAGSNQKALEELLLRLPSEASNRSSDAQNNFQFSAADMLQRSSAESTLGFSLVHTASYMAMKDVFHAVLKALSEIDLSEDVSSNSNLKQSMEPTARAQCIGKMLFSTEAKPQYAPMARVNVRCFFSDIALSSEKQDKDNLAEILCIMHPYLLLGKNRHGHSLLGIAAATMAHEDNTSLLDTILKCSHHASQPWWESFWAHYTANENSAFWNEKDSNGLTPFAYICIFADPETYINNKWINREVLKKVVTTKFVEMEVGEKNGEMRSVYWPHPLLFRELQYATDVNLAKTRFSYMHLAALARNLPMLKYLAEAHEMDTFQVVNSIPAVSGDLNGFTVCNCLNVLDCMSLGMGPSLNKRVAMSLE